MKAAHILFPGLVAATLVTASCTMKNQEAPPLTGPAEFGTSVTVSVTPDVLAQDGASQSVVTVTARDSNGQPLANIPMRAEIRVGGQVADFGTLSAKSIVSGPDGRTTLVYTAPANLSGVESLIDIAVTPLSSSYGDQVARSATIRLVPPGVVVPPSGLSPAFTISPESPLQGQDVLFSARTSTAPRTTRYPSIAGTSATAASAPVSRPRPPTTRRAPTSHG